MRRGGGACPRPPAGDHHGLAASARRGALRFAATRREEYGFVVGKKIDLGASLSRAFFLSPAGKVDEEQTNYCAPDSWAAATTGSVLPENTIVKNRILKLNRFDSSLDELLCNSLPFRWIPVKF